MPSKIGSKTRFVVGSKYGILTLLDIEYCKKKGTYVSARVRCDCGNEKIISYSALCNATKVNKCTCNRRRRFYKKGDMFGKLTLLKDKLPKPIPEKQRFDVKCECGVVKNVSYSCLIESIKRNKCTCSSVDAIGHNFSEKRYALHYAEWKRDSRKLFQDLSYSEFERLITSPCVYCGSLGSERHTGLIINGIDRRDNDKGYTVSNSVSCCWKCNKMKGSMNVSDFKTHILKIASFLNET